MIRQPDVADVDTEDENRLKIVGKRGQIGVIVLTSKCTYAKLIFSLENRVFM